MCSWPGRFFPHHAGTVVFALYLTSVILVLGGGLVLRQTAFRDVHTEPLILVLSPYQRPHLRTLGMSVRMRLSSFVTGAGKIILVTMLVLGALMALPATGQHSIGQVPVADSGTVAPPRTSPRCWPRPASATTTRSPPS